MRQRNYVVEFARSGFIVLELDCVYVFKNGFSLVGSAALFFISCIFVHVREATKSFLKSMQGPHREACKDLIEKSTRSFSRSVQGEVRGVCKELELIYTKLDFLFLNFRVFISNKRERRVHVVDSRCKTALETSSKALSKLIPELRNLVQAVNTPLCNILH